MPPANPGTENKYQRARELSGCAQDASEVVATPTVRPNNLRLRRVCRDGVVPMPVRIEDLLPDEHLARRMWEATERLDLTAFYAPIVVVEGGPGHAATDPQILVALWLYATSQGVTSARELNSLCGEHLAVRRRLHELSYLE